MLTRTRFVVRVSSAIALAVLATIVVTAQSTSNTPPPRMLVQTISVRPDAVPQWRALQEKEAVPAYKKGGMPWRWVFESGPLSGDGSTFVSLLPIENYARFDSGSSLRRGMGEEAFAKFNARLQSLQVGNHNQLQTLIPSASLRSGSSSPPSLARVTDFLVRPGKTEEFDALTASEYLPAVKKAGMTDYLVFGTNYGAPFSQRTVVTYLKSYADLDRGGPIARALGPDAARALNQRRDELTTSATSVVLRFVPELSYGAPVAGTK